MWASALTPPEGRRLRWFAECDLSVARDGELLDLMRRTGCAQVLIGLESPVEEGLPGLEMRSDWKHRMYPHYEEAIRLNPNSPSAFNRRGLAHRRSGDLACAIDDYTAAITLNPVYALAYNNRGYVYRFTDPVPVVVTRGRVLGKRKRPIKR